VCETTPATCGSHPSIGGEVWNPNKAVIDCFGDLPIKEIVEMLTLVGFSSPPSWIKPYSVLSNGEKFRCDLAKALLRHPRESGGLDERREHNKLDSRLRGNDGNIVCFDEYTSVVDRNVAKIASAALSKAIKTGKIKRRFVAVTCHYDILDWLEPDWVLDTASGVVSRRLLQRPCIELELFRCERRLWNMFKTHHYLSGNLAKHCRCYAACLKVPSPSGGGLGWGLLDARKSPPPNPLPEGGGTLLPVAFCALIPQQGFKNWYRVSRIVTLPDYQGVGIGARFLDTLAELYVEQDYRFSITASHPSVLSHCKRSEHWKAINVQKIGSKHSSGRAVVSFEYIVIPAQAGIQIRSMNATN
jgi:hypothetical protein